MIEACSGVRMCKLTWSGQKLKLGAAKIEVANPTIPAVSDLGQTIRPVEASRRSGTRGRFAHENRRWYKQDKDGDAMSPFCQFDMQVSGKSPRRKPGM